MAFSRYKNTPKLALGTQYGTSRTAQIIRNEISSGRVPIIDVVTLSGNQRLDHLSAIYYKDSKYWWILAAASEIGWGLQLPPGTVIVVPDLSAIAALIG